MTKRKMSENSLKNLKPFSQRTPEERQEYGKKGAEKTNKIRREKRQRANMLGDIFELLNKEGIIDGTIDAIKEEVKRGKIKNAIELLKLVKPNEAQIQQITGSLGFQKIFITEKEKQETDEHIDNVINEQ